MNPIVSSTEWTTARKQLLAREKELTRLRDELSRARRELPWERVDKPYTFHTARGTQTLADLFGTKQQLVVYHFMFGPDSKQGCPSCSFWADNFDGITAHLAARDVQLTAISRAPLAKLQAYAQRLGWTFPWASASETDFNFDFGVSFRDGEPAMFNYAPYHGGSSEREGISVFYKDANGAVLHTYSCYARGLELMNGAYGYLDLVPKGRDEAGLPWPMAWIKRHDEYER
ncbi:MAG TPA: DUF899 domain-containing protein [Kofleriaceae bacterium]|nr:DUF899 domain-containing protein [Kofleriaceae bacterium]